jgi:hypothetical protein
MTKLTRRELAAAVAGGAAVALQKPAAAQAPADLDNQARASKRTAAQSLAQVELPIETEPCFHFKA